MRRIWRTKRRNEAPTDERKKDGRGCPSVVNEPEEDREREKQKRKQEIDPTELVGAVSRPWIALDSID